MKAGSYIRGQHKHALRMAQSFEEQAVAFQEKASECLKFAKEHRESAERWAAETDILSDSTAVTSQPSDPRGPFFSTAWEREDYERSQRGEPELGPSVSSQHPRALEE